MRKGMVYILCFLLLCSSFPVNASQVEALKGEAVITSDRLNVRSGPSKEYEIMGVLEKNDEVEVTGIVRPDWYRIDYGGEYGYIHGDYLVFIEESGEIEDPVFTMKTYLVIGLVAVIFFVFLLLVCTAMTLRRREEGEDEEEKDDHSHQGEEIGVEEVTYDTYRLDIDPAYFETTTLISQPDRIHLQEDRNRESSADIEEIDSKLEQATAQLAALQREVEELKKKKEETGIGEKT